MRLSKRREGKNLSGWQCFKLLPPAHFADSQRYAPAPIPSKARCGQLARHFSPLLLVGLRRGPTATRSGTTVATTNTCRFSQTPGFWPGVCAFDMDGQLVAHRVWSRQLTKLAVRAKAP
jgi:hypothetical protein